MVCIPCTVMSFHRGQGGGGVMEIIGCDSDQVRFRACRTKTMAVCPIKYTNILVRKLFYNCCMDPGVQVFVV